MFLTDELLEAPIPLVQTAPSPQPAAVQPISIEPPAPLSAEGPVLEFGGPVEAEEAPIPLVTSAAGPDVSEFESAEELGEDDLISVAPPARESEPPAEVTVTSTGQFQFDGHPDECKTGL